MISYYCEECGKECVAKSQSLVRRFCSHKCANANRWKKANKKETTIFCKHCKKPFTVKSSDHRVKNGTIKYCSKRCEAEDRKKEKPEAAQFAERSFIRPETTAAL